MVFSSELLTGYSIFRKDRTGKTGGGVFVAVKNEFKVSRRTDLEGEKRKWWWLNHYYCTFSTVTQDRLRKFFFNRNPP